MIPENMRRGRKVQKKKKVKIEYGKTKRLNEEEEQRSWGGAGRTEGERQNGTLEEHWWKRHGKEQVSIQVVGEEG